ncbi:LacI family DNA-binding transcriptional regulator [Tolypothrix bouteillei VB521301_2]|uniref:LacI family DNA-binding transcriptional regulator n=1 Tax=Tolypothrix bouteillei TaxID=1246981 RepID=UPI000513B809
MNISKCFDQTLKKYGITGTVLSKKVGVSASHVSQFRNGKGGAVSHKTLEEMLNAMEELAPGSRLYFCLLLAGKDPVEFLAGGSSNDLRNLILTASPDLISEIIELSASWIRTRKNADKAEVVSAVL